MKFPKRRIACFIHSLSGGGAERVMARLASEWTKAGHEIHLITLDDGQEDRHTLHPKTMRHCLDLMAVSKNAWEGWKNDRKRIRIVRSTIESIAPEVVLSFCDRNNILASDAVAPTGIPIVLSERSDPSQQKLGRYWSYRRRVAYRRATNVVAQTPPAAGYLSQTCGIEVDVIPSAVDHPTESMIGPATSRFHQHQWQLRRLIGVGRFEHEKGFDRLVDAFTRIAPQYPDWQLALFGDGSQKEDLLEHGKKASVQDRFHISPWRRPIWPVYAEAGIFVLPSRYEGFPSALLEAMACGCPVVSVDCPSGPAAIVQHEVDGLLVPDSVHGIIDGVMRLIDDPGLAEKLGQQARQVVDRFSWERMLHAYEVVLNQAIAASPTN